VNNTTKYVVGPIGLEKAAAPIAASYVDFSKGAEVLMGDYHTSDGGATLMLIDYPTPQIAKAQLSVIAAAQRCSDRCRLQRHTRTHGGYIAEGSGPQQNTERRRTRWGGGCGGGSTADAVSQVSES